LDEKKAIFIKEFAPLFQMSDSKQKVPVVNRLVKHCLQVVPNGFAECAPIVVSFANRNSNHFKVNI
jgi:hypothetical protein